MRTKNRPFGLATEATGDPVQSTWSGGEGPGLMGVGSKENRKRGTFWQLSTDNPSEGFAKSRSRETEQ